MQLLCSSRQNNTWLQSNVTALSCLKKASQLYKNLQSACRKKATISNKRFFMRCIFLQGQFSAVTAALIAAGSNTCVHAVSWFYPLQQKLFRPTFHFTKTSSKVKKHKSFPHHQYIETWTAGISILLWLHFSWCQSDTNAVLVMIIISNQIIMDSAVNLPADLVN